MKTIEERAKEYESNIGSQDYVSVEIEEAFKAGAEWMIVRATAWLVKQGLKTNDGVVTICVEDFIKAMEE